jgi:hypothetical protein
VLWNVGVARMEASAAGVFTNVVPVVGLLFALGVGETITWLQILGGVVAGMGIVLVQRTRAMRSIPGGGDPDDDGASGDTRPGGPAPGVRGGLEDLRSPRP